MTMEKISWEYIDGVPAMMRLTKMLETAIPEALPKIAFKPTAGWTWRGFYLGPDFDFFLGVYYDRPTVLLFANERGSDNATYDRRLDLETTHFFALTGDEQFQLIVDFAKQAYADAPK